MPTLKEIDEMEAFFKSYQLPETCKLNVAITLTKPKMYIDICLNQVKAAPDHRLNEVRWDDLVILRKQFDQNYQIPPLPVPAK